MRAVEFKQQNMVYRGTKESSDKTEDLPVHVYDRGIVSCWKMSLRERLKALWTGVIWFDILGKTQPPIWLGADAPFEPQKKNEKETAK